MSYVNNGLKCFALLLGIGITQGCASTSPTPPAQAPVATIDSSAVDENATPIANAATVERDQSTTEPSSNSQQLQALSINRIRKTGTLQNRQLTEVSGISASSRYPGVLYAINDSGHSNTLFAISETGQSVAQWRINSANNRDWEDLTRIELQGTSYLVIGDTGDNLRVHPTATLHLLREPAIPAVSSSLQPVRTLQFTFDEGPRNIEAFSAIDNKLYLLSKEPVIASERQPHRVYELDIQQALATQDVAVAKRVATMAQSDSNVETWLAAAFAKVDLTHPTALEFDTSSNSAYVLTYREVLKFSKLPTQDWPEVFAQKPERIWSHRLPQAEALGVSIGRALWISSEGRNAPLWALPLQPPS